VDLRLKKRLDQFRSLDKSASAYKTAAVFLAFVPVLGWIAARYLWKEGTKARQLQQGLIDEFVGQLAIDTKRDFVVSINGRKYTDAKEFWEALDKTELSLTDKYTVLQLSHQGLYATVALSNTFQMLDWGEKHCPLTQVDDQPIRRRQPSDKRDIFRSYCNVKDVGLEGNKTVRLAIQGKQCTVSSSLQQALSVMDLAAPPPYQERVVFEFDTQFAIDVNQRKMTTHTSLDRINPLTGPVRQYARRVDSNPLSETDATSSQSDRSRSGPLSSLESHSPSE